MEKMLVEKNVGRARSLAGAESAGEGELRKYSRFTPTDRYIYRRAQTLTRRTPNIIQS